ncbi:ribosome biogenesis/translation initiation ATPase RLI [Sulfolobus acidocaldarius]|uniref:RNase L inhibitor-like protein n=4 Tax=Sulfolobus acidocaldarius TaxID=2285 RepID=Q4JAX3_SULAC|nr:ribosome biogenesis/translation initiation ATPase RLI [Sulfolobus acidocaldarius]AAY80056.1 RNase L inhibitor-like protein [Sulfolobus acidocaldarius DSM 639]AGE70627.1 putative ATPase RIL [Sulfolobus acidocaldarius N8]AGE72900.1 putative ATPase RIL [Sulfolobus acidocaldarius Ron12/I]ALU29021.1 ATPase [Sulfolobus acidocaldarius]ALU31748.1 ATPase [Sulfolobus acidocaldarius]
MRVAVINYDYCKPDKCRLECIAFCPINKSGSKAIELSEIVKGKPIIYEETCIGCGICIKKCPFDAIDIVNLPDEYGKDETHRYKVNGFKLFGMITPKKGSIIGILGKNSTGKSTILRILSGELIPNFGNPQEVLTKDQVLDRFKGKEIYNYFQSLYNNKLKVVHKIQYVEYASKYLKGSVKDLLTKVDQRGKIDEVKSMLNLTPFWEKDVSVLSGGELQKLLVSASLLRDADVYLFDEPSSYLDIRERINLAIAIRELTKGRYTIVVEHDLIVLDYLADVIHIIYGKSSVYGRVSKSYSSRVGINNFLHGYLPAENIQIRSDAIKFNLRELTELDLNPHAVTKVIWTAMEKQLNGFSLSIEEGNAREGEIIGIVGPNGIGKTTFMRILVSEITPDHGNVLTEGLTLSYKPQRLAPNYEGTVQEYLENVRKDILSSSSWFFEEVIKRLNLHRILESNVRDLSGGELQKLYVAGALAKEADIYVIDEPSSYLDVEERYIVAKAIKRVSRERKSVTFVVDHDLAIHDYIADRIMVFSGVPGSKGIARSPQSLATGMNQFLKELGITFRRDSDSGRPRVNKFGSYLDRLQKETGEYYSMKISREEEST